MKPISPKDIDISLPTFVILGINNAIREKYRGKEFTITQNEIIQYILAVAPEGTTKDILYEKSYLDFEGVYAREGWKVLYDKPGYNESYDAYFKFIPK